MNPVIVLVLYWRAHGVKHSDIPWRRMRKLYDYTEELVEVISSGPVYLEDYEKEKENEKDSTDSSTSAD